jgi:hypothetical protein
VGAAFIAAWERIKLAIVSDGATLDGLADVEAELLARLDVVAGADGGADSVVLLGLVNAGRVPSAASLGDRL